MADEKLIFDLLTGQNTIAKDLSAIKGQTSSVEKNIGSITNGFADVGKSISGLSAGVAGFATAAVAAIGAFIGAEVVKAAEEQENAINRLNAALKVNGNFSASASEELIAYAESLQKTTTVADDITIANLALLQSLAPLTKDGLIAANEAAINLSSALRIDLETAVRLVGKAANGETDAFKRYGVEIKKGATDAETFASALTTLNSKFGGAATNELNTFAGAVARSKNAFGDILEEIGNIVIKTPELIDLIRSSADTFGSIAESIKGAAPAIRSFFGEAILQAQDFTIAIQNAADAVIKSDFGRILGASLRDTGDAVKNVFDLVVAGSVKAGEALGLFTQEAKNVDSGFGEALSSTDKTFNAIITGAGLSTNKVKELNKELLKTGSAGLSDELKKSIESQVKSLEAALKNVGLTQKQIIAAEVRERTDLIAKAEKAGLITREKAEKDLTLIRLNGIEKTKKADKEASDERRKRLQESIQIAAQNPLNLAFKDVKIDLPDKIQSAFAGIFGTLTNITKGAAGASQFLSGFAGAASNALAPGTGQAAQEVFSLLAQGPAKVKETFDAFFINLPTVIENIIASIPQILISLAENIGIIIDRLATSIPAAIESFLQRLPEVAVALIEAMVRAAFAFQTRMPAVAAQMAISLTAEMPRVAVEFVNQLVKEAPRFITELIKSIPGSIGGVGQAIGGIPGSIGGLFGGIGDVFGFADGGLVPGSAPFTDRVPALLTPGEAVVDRSLTEKLDRFLAGAGPQTGPTTIQLVIGEEQIANVILDLNRRGFRLS